MCPATTGHSSLLTSATYWTGARRPRIQKQKVERGIVPQVLGLSNEWAANVKVSCFHMDVSCLQCWGVLKGM